MHIIIHSLKIVPNTLKLTPFYSSWILTSSSCMTSFPCEFEPLPKRVFSSRVSVQPRLPSTGSKNLGLILANAIAPIPTLFEYSNHSADILLHAYGKNFAQALESSAYALISYMYKYPNKIDINPLLTHTIQLEANDMQTLIEFFLNEILSHTTNYYDELEQNIQELIGTPIFPGMAPRSIRVMNLTGPQNAESAAKSLIFDCARNSAKYSLTAEIQGNFINIAELGAGTEVKAITTELTLVERLPLTHKTRPDEVHIQVLIDI